MYPKTLLRSYSYIWVPTRAEFRWTDPKIHLKSCVLKLEWNFPNQPNELCLYKILMTTLLVTLRAHLVLSVLYSCLHYDHLLLFLSSNSIRLLSRRRFSLPLPQPCVFIWYTPLFIFACIQLSNWTEWHLISEIHIVLSVVRSDWRFGGPIWSPAQQSSATALFPCWQLGGRMT